MGKPSIFISCGQFTDAERVLGNAIADLVKRTTSFEPFFAEQVQDLNGLDSNILYALGQAAALIVVLHPRGVVQRPDGTTIMRASVWIEQEVAIATYIERTERRKLPVLAFIHTSVGREGIRDLIHLNPIRFAQESSILDALPGLLKKLDGLESVGVHAELRSSLSGNQQGHVISRLEATLVNESNHSIDEYHVLVRIPSSILKHWEAIYPSEVKSEDSRYRRFRFSAKDFGPVPPQDKRKLFMFHYCTQCALGPAGGISALVSEAEVSVRLWSNGREYESRKTIEELARDH